MNDYKIKSQNILKIEIMWLINREKESLKKSEITNLEGRMISLLPPLLNNPPRQAFSLTSHFAYSPIKALLNTTNHGAIFY